MAEQQGNTPPHSPNVDPMTAFWRDVWARSAASMPNMAGMPNMPGMPGMPGMAGIPGMGAMPGMDPAAAASFMSPEVLRRMQGAFFEAMAQYAEQYMRSPQFLEAMKRSMDQALQFKRQMDDFLKSNMANAFETASGGANTEILGAIRQTSAQLQSHIDSQLSKLDARIANLEQAAGQSRHEASRPHPTTSPSAPPAATQAGGKKASK
ncbi:MAG: hypothetical protein JNL80_03495 [Phycisphaerae bacterium]|jgi:hypothetical protein|nr:hypothetical protein [Phycisphaerae bacterium]